MKNSVSVIMSVYNEDKASISASVGSILNQKLQDFELILVDDGSGIETKEFLNELVRKDRRIILVSNSENKGLAASLNKAISFAAGKFIARMDADDISHPLRLHRQLEYLISNSEIDVVGSHAIKINESGRKVGKIATPTNSDHMPTHLLFNSCLVHPSVMVRSDFYKETGGYISSFVKAQDYELWTRGVMNGFKYANIKECLLSYRVYGASLSSAKLKAQAFYSDKVRKKYIQSIVRDAEESEIDALLWLANPVGKDVEPLCSSLDMIFKKLAKNDLLNNLILSKIIIRRCGVLALKYHEPYTAAGILKKWVGRL